MFLRCFLWTWLFGSLACCLWADSQHSKENWFQRPCITCSWVKSVKMKSCNNGTTVLAPGVLCSPVEARCISNLTSRHSKDYHSWNHMSAMKRSANKLETLSQRPFVQLKCHASELVWVPNRASALKAKASICCTAVRQNGCHAESNCGETWHQRKKLCKTNDNKTKPTNWAAGNSSRRLQVRFSSGHVTVWNNAYTLLAEKTQADKFLQSCDL